MVNEENGLRWRCDDSLAAWRVVRPTIDAFWCRNSVEGTPELEVRWRRIEVEWQDGV